MKQSFPGKVCLLVLFVICTGVQLFAQKITGVVVDDSNTPIPGVTIVLKGSTTGTITSVSDRESGIPSKWSNFPKSESMRNI